MIQILSLLTLLLKKRSQKDSLDYSKYNWRRWIQNLDCPVLYCTVQYAGKICLSSHLEDLQYVRTNRENSKKKIASTKLSVSKIFKFNVSSLKKKAIILFSQLHLSLNLSEMVKSSSIFLDNQFYQALRWVLLHSNLAYHSPKRKARRDMCRREEMNIREVWRGEEKYEKEKR